MANSAEPTTRPPKPRLAAPLWHTLGLLMILLAFSAGLYRMQSRSPAAGEQHHGNVVPYLSVIISEWAMFFYIWLGGLIPGATQVRDLVGGRWSNRKDVLRDIARACAFWAAVTAGFCEELVFRGYLQRQGLALTGSVALAVLTQGVLFGVAHWYQGVKMVIVITALGIVFGIFANWRKSLRPVMIAHALADIVNL